MPKIAIAVSRFNEEVTEKLLEGALDRLKEKNIPTDSFHVVYVPGAVELPFAALRLSQTKKFDAIIVLGAVIRGETDHYTWVCQQVSYGCQKVALEQAIPVVFGVLTTDNDAQAMDRVGGAHGHKGKDCVDTALEMIELSKTLTT